MNRLLLEGKTAIITGASKGIGRSIAGVFAEEGANVILTARGKEALDAAVKEINAKGGHAVGMAADAYSRERCEEVFAEAIRLFGQVDILVNNAGIANTKTIENTTDEMWDEVMNTNVTGLFRYCREAARHMLPRGTGVILNIASCCGLKPLSGCSYSTSKGAAITITKNLAYRFVGTDIRCNCICPGRVETPLQVEARKKIKDASADEVNMHEFGDRYCNRSVPPLEPEGQAYTALFLASDLARDITGAVIPVDRGSYLP